MITFTKKCVIKFLAQFGYEFARIKPKVDKNLIDVLALLVPRIDSARPFTLVHIGANDGVYGDPVHHLLRYNWRGVMVEPNPLAFKSLVQNMRSCLDIRCENSAISTYDGNTDFYCTASDDSDETILGSLNKSAASIASTYANGMRKISVKSLTLRTLFNLYDINHISLFVVDAEGSDYNILCQLFALGKSPEIIQFENAMMTVKEFKHIMFILNNRGYKTIQRGVDTIACL